jgi:hypothetical protein
VLRVDKTRATLLGANAKPGVCQATQWQLVTCQWSSIVFHAADCTPNSTLPGSKACIKTYDRSRRGKREVGWRVPSRAAVTANHNELVMRHRSPQVQPLSAGSCRKNQAVACLCVTSSTNGPLIHACYPVVFSLPRHIRRTYFRHHLCDVSIMRSTGNRSVKRRQRGFGRQKDAMDD